jgi:hypothetical protein
LDGARKERMRVWVGNSKGKGTVLRVFKRKRRDFKTANCE